MSRRSAFSSFYSKWSRVEPRKVKRASLMVAITAAAAFRPAPANAADIMFSNYGIGDFGSAANWNLGNGPVPGAADQADVSTGGTATIVDGENFTVLEAWAGNATNARYGVIQQSGGTLTATNWLVVGRYNSQGEYDLSGDGVINHTSSAGEIQIVGQSGSDGSAIFTMQDNSVINMGTSNTSANCISIGDTGFGHWYMNSTANGSPTINLNLSGLYLGNGNGGTGVLDMNGGSITSTATGGGQVIVGFNGGTGTLNLNAGTINTNSAEFWIGQANASTSGVVNLNGGMILANNWIAIGRGGAIGTLNLNGGLIASTANHVTMGSVGGTGFVNQTGGTFNGTNALYLGETGPGTFNLSGGVANFPSVNIGLSAGGSGTLNFTGGTLNTGGFTVNSSLNNYAGVNFGGTANLVATAANTNYFANLSTGSVTLSAGTLTFNNGGYAVTVSQGFNGSAGGGGLVSVGAGTLTLSGSSSYTGDTTVQSGTLMATAPGALGVGSNVNVSAGAVLAINNDPAVAGKNLALSGELEFLNYSSALNLSGAPLTLGAATGTASALTGTITDNGTPTTLNYVGPGTLSLNSSNSYSGGTNVSAGVLIEGVPSALGTGPVIVSGTGTLGLTSDNGIPGGIVFNGGGLTFENYNSNLNLSTSGNLTLGAAAGTPSSLAGVISNNGSNASSVTYIGPGTLSLTASNTYTGGTNISAGALNASSGALGSGNILLQGGATLIMAPGNTTDYTVGRTFSLGTGGGTLNVSTNAVTFTGSILDPLATGTLSGYLTKSGTGSLTLGGSLTTTDLFVRQGALILTGSASVSTTYNGTSTANDYSSIGQIAGDNGLLSLSGNAVFTGAGDVNIGDVSATGTLNVSGNAVVNARTLAVGKYGTSVGTVNQTGGTIQYATNGVAGGDWRIGGYGSTADSAAVGIYNMSGGTLIFPGNFQVGDYGTGTLIQTGGTANIGTGTGGYVSIGRFAGGTGTLDLSSGTGTFNGSNAPYFIIGEQGTGTLKLGGSETVNTTALSIAHDDGSTGTVLQTGGTLNAPSGVIFGTTAAGVTAATGVYNLSGGTIYTSKITKSTQATVSGTFNFNGGNVVYTPVAGAVSGPAGNTLISGLTAANVQAGGASFNTNGNSVYISQALSHDPTAGAPAIDGGLNKIGAGTLYLQSAATYTGPTNISSGTLQLFPAVAPLVHYSFDQTAGALTTGATIVNDGSGGSAYNATINGSGAAITATSKFGSGALTLDGTGTSIDLAAGSTNFNQSASWTVSTEVKFSNALAARGAAILYKGSGTTFTTGNTQVYLSDGNTGASSNSISSPTVERSGSSTLLSATSTTTVGNNAYHLVTITDNAGVDTVYVDGVAVTSGTNNSLSTTPGDIGTIIRVGIGIGTNSLNYKGSLDEFRIDNVGITAQQAAQLNASNYILSSTASVLPVTTPVNLLASGAGLSLPYINQTVASVSGVTGTTVNIASGSITFNNPSAITTTFAGTIIGTAGTVNMAGLGNQILSGANTYTGNTTITAGTLTAANTTGSATGTGTVFISGGTLASGSVGTISGAVNSSGGTIAPGGIGSIGTLTIGSLVSTSATTLNFDLGTGTGIVTSGDLLKLSAASTIASGTAITFNTSSTVAGDDYRLVGGTLTGINVSNFALPAAPSGEAYSLSTSVDTGYIDLVVTSVTGGANTLIFNNTGGTGDGTTFATGTSSSSYQNFQNVGTSSASYFNSGDLVTFNDNNNGHYNVSVSGVVTPGSTTFNNSTGNYNVSAAAAGSGIGGAGGLTKLGSGTVTLSTTDTYTGATQVSGGKLVLASSSALPSTTTLNIASGATVQVANHGSGAITVVQVSNLSNGGLIDVTNNDFILKAGGAAGVTTVYNQIKSGFNGGAWNGTTGITSSLAAANPTHLTAVGELTGVTSFEGLTVGSSDVLVKYTYYGDANLDGAVDGSDYTKIDNGFNNHLTGWYNGDFNYDGVIDGSDYTLIDNAFNIQGASLGTNPAALVASATAQIGGGSAVPEPTAIGLITVGAAGLLSRRRRR